jgi:hypothetical protein
MFHGITIGQAIMFFICGSVLILTLYSLGINICDWIIKVIAYAKLGWLQFSYPDFNEKILKIKYDIYVVGFPSGEIFYVDKKKINKLKRKELIKWDSEYLCYVFEDEDIEEIKKIASPIITFRYERQYYSLDL